MRVHGFPHTNGKSFDEYGVYGKYIANIWQIFTGAYIRIFHKFWRICLHSHAHATKSKMRSGSKVQWPTSVYIKPSSKWTWVTLDLPFQFLLLRRRAVDRCMRHQCHSGQPLVMHCVFSISYRFSNKDLTSRRPGCRITAFIRDFDIETTLKGKISLWRNWIFTNWQNWWVSSLQLKAEKGTDTIVFFF